MNMCTYYLVLYWLNLLFFLSSRIGEQSSLWVVVCFPVFFHCRYYNTHFPVLFNKHNPWGRLFSTTFGTKLELPPRHSKEKKMSLQLMCTFFSWLSWSFVNEKAEGLGEWPVGYTECPAPAFGSRGQGRWTWASNQSGMHLPSIGKPVFSSRPPDLLQRALNWEMWNYREYWKSENRRSVYCGGLSVMSQKGEIWHLVTES